MRNNIRRAAAICSIPVISFFLISCNSGSSSSSNSASAISYAPFNCPGSNNVSFPGVSGVRGVYGVESNVYVTGVYVQYGSPHAFLYKGSVDGGGSCAAFNYPSSPGITVTSTSLYGPDNNGANRVIAVGSYTTLESGTLTQQGLLYIGADDGSTISGYQTLYPQSLTAESVINTLGHSTMGGIVVGNYDTRLVTGKGFIYNINNGTYYPLDKPDGSVSLTLYGVWYNGGTSYTITGGYSAVLQGGVDAGFITDWDSATQRVTHFTTLNYNNSALSLIGTHFEGITGDNSGGYYLAADWQYNSLGGTYPAFAHITRNPDGSFAVPQWTGFAYYPGSSWTSANTVYQNKVLGLYQKGTPVMNYGYVATIPLP